MDGGKLTWTFPALVRRRRIAQGKHDKNKTSGDQSRPDPVNAPVFLRRWFVFKNKNPIVVKARAIAPVVNIGVRQVGL